MLLKKLETVAFRNLVDQKLELHPGINIFSGDNAQGKSNLLEGVLLLTGLCTLRRGTRGQEMIRFGEQRAVVRGSVLAGGMQRDLEVQITAAGRRTRLDGKAPRSAAEYLQGLGVVTFTPEELGIPRGGPAGRRRLLDQAVAAQWPACTSLLRDYQKVLASRNKLLVQLAGQGGAFRRHPLYEMLLVYDQKLAELGGRVLAARLRYVARIEPLMKKAFEEITQGNEPTGLAYRSTDAVMEAGDRIAGLSAALEVELKQGMQQDLARKATLRGPHTDDLEFLIHGRSTRCYGSQGQVRAVILALKVAQIIDSGGMLGDYPLLLLDDVSSELDQKRSKYLFEFIQKISCQTLITTSRPEMLEIQVDRKYFQVVSGSVNCGAAT